MESSFKNMVLVLTSIACLSGAILGSVNALTKDAIDQSKLAKQENAIKTVAPAYDNNPIADQWETDLPDGTKAIIFPAKMGDETVGAAVQATTKKGFSGEITIMVGFDKEGTIKDYIVLQHAETPGLGSKMQDWYHTKSNILGMNPSKNNLKIKSEGCEVDAITAATITSVAFFDAVSNAYNAFTNTQDAESGATSKNPVSNEEEVI